MAEMNWIAGGQHHGALISEEDNLAAPFVYEGVQMNFYAAFHCNLEELRTVCIFVPADLGKEERAEAFGRLMERGFLRLARPAA